MRILVTCVVSALLLAGCQWETRHRNDHPLRGRPSTPVHDKLIEPDSKVWPLAMWLIAFGDRNGCHVTYDDRDVAEIEVVEPGPGPYSDAQARAVLEKVAREFYLVVEEVKPHAYRIRKSRAIVR